MSSFDLFAINSVAPETFKTREEVVSHIKTILQEKFDSICCNVVQLTKTETMMHYGTFYIKVISWADSTYFTMTIYSCIAFQRGDSVDDYYKSIMIALNPNMKQVLEPFEGTIIETVTMDWHGSFANLLKFFDTTLTRWCMNPRVDNNRVICRDEGFAIEIGESSRKLIDSKFIFEINLLSDKKHIDSMIMEIFECLRVQAKSDTELTEDEAYALITTDLKSMNEYQVQLYMYNLGRESRDEIDQWTVEHTGYCNNLLRVSYGKFDYAVVCVDLKNLNNVCGASFKNCRIASGCHFENVTFVECIFENVEFECALKNVKFDNCVLQKISWPTKNCGITVYNDEEDDDERSYSEYEDDM
jgi:hypothetical protein